MAPRTLPWLVLFALVVALALRIHGHLGAAQNDTLAREQAVYQRLRNVIKERYVREVDDERLFFGAMEGMTSSLDPHSDFLPPREYEALNTSITGHFEGIGIDIHPDKEKGLTVLTPMPGSPALLAGILPGDRIVAIDGVNIEKMDREESTRLIKGAINTRVKLSIMRDNAAQPIEITVLRGVIEVNSVQVSEILPAQNFPDQAASNIPRIGFIHLAQFGQRTLAEFEDALNVLEKKGMQALIIDLRQNLGGSLEAAENVSDLFIKEGIIVTVITRAAAAARDGGRVRRARAEGTHPDYPIAVLVDSRSASASEIVSGALRDNGRAVLVGDKTFGKFSVQDVIEVPLDKWGNAALKLTIASYKTPLSPCVDGQGHIPDVYVPSSLEQQRDLVFSRRRRFLQDHNPVPSKPVMYSELEKSAGFIDQQLKKAIEVLSAKLKKDEKQTP